MAGLRARECGTVKVNSISDLLGALAVCDEHRARTLSQPICPNLRLGGRVVHLDQPKELRGGGGVAKQSQALKPCPSLHYFGWTNTI